MSIVLIVLFVVYGLLLLLMAASCFFQPRLPASSGALLLASAAAVAAAPFVTLRAAGLALLLIGMIFSHLAAWQNGKRLFGKPHVSHQLIRLLINLVLLAAFIFIFH
ncbi:MAG: hypothetical protein ABF868_12090 [Sporolactobacillus sp.]